MKALIRLHFLKFLRLNLFNFFFKLVIFLQLIIMKKSGLTVIFEKSGSFEELGVGITKFPVYTYYTLGLSVFWIANTGFHINCVRYS